MLPLKYNKLYRIIYCSFIGFIAIIEIVRVANDKLY